MIIKIGTLFKDSALREVGGDRGENKCANQAINCWNCENSGEGQSSKGGMITCA